jgi:hypothetical protein
MKTLLIDDFRCLPADTTARTYDEGIKELETGQYTRLLLDHDLGEKDIRKTGYNIVCWMEEHMDLAPEEVKLVTSNPVGMINMQAALSAMNYRFDIYGDLWRKPLTKQKEE